MFSLNNLSSIFHRFSFDDYDSDDASFNSSSSSENEGSSSTMYKKKKNVNSNKNNWNTTRTLCANQNIISDDDSRYMDEHDLNFFGYGQNYKHLQHQNHRHIHVTDEDDGISQLTYEHGYDDDHQSLNSPSTITPSLNSYGKHNPFSNEEVARKWKNQSYSPPSRSYHSKQKNKLTRYTNFSRRKKYNVKGNHEYIEDRSNDVNCNNSDDDSCKSSFSQQDNDSTQVMIGSSNDKIIKSTSNSSSSSSISTSNSNNERKQLFRKTLEVASNQFFLPSLQETQSEYISFSQPRRLVQSESLQAKPLQQLRNTMKQNKFSQVKKIPPPPPISTIRKRFSGSQYQISPVTSHKTKALRRIENDKQSGCDNICDMSPNTSLSRERDDELNHHFPSQHQTYQMKTPERRNFRPQQVSSSRLGSKQSQSRFLLNQSKESENHAKTTQRLNTSPKSITSFDDVHSQPHQPQSQSKSFLTHLLKMTDSKGQIDVPLKSSLTNAKSNHQNCHHETEKHLDQCSDLKLSKRREWMNTMWSPENLFSDVFSSLDDEDEESLISMEEEKVVTSRQKIQKSDETHTSRKDESIDACILTGYVERNGNSRDPSLANRSNVEVVSLCESDSVISTSLGEVHTSYISDVSTSDDEEQTAAIVKKSVNRNNHISHKPVCSPMISSVATDNNIYFAPKELHKDNDTNWFDPEHFPSSWKKKMFEQQTSKNPFNFDEYYLIKQQKSGPFQEISFGSELAKPELKLMNEHNILPDEMSFHENLEPDDDDSCFQLNEMEQSMSLLSKIRKGKLGRLVKRFRYKSGSRRLNEKKEKRNFFSWNRNSKDNVTDANDDFDWNHEDEIDPMSFYSPLDDDEDVDTHNNDEQNDSVNGDLSVPFDENEI